MTEQQQAIIALFNTKDAANMEIAQECAISTGLGRWFNRYINKLIAKISIVLKADNVDVFIYSDFDAQLYINSDYKIRHKCLASALAFFAFNLHKHNVSGNFSYCEFIVFDTWCNQLHPTFDYNWYDTIVELKSLGCRFDEF
mgnify:CR=1 FL=1